VEGGKDALIVHLFSGAPLRVEIPPVEEAVLVEEAGRGGSGDVFRIRSRGTGDEFALKVIGDVRLRTDEGEELLRRLENEASLAISSRHLIRAYGMRAWDSTTYLLLFEYFQSRNLREALEDGDLSAREKREILHQTLLAVRDAHRMNIIHRDLKPANILVNREGTVKVCDFGIAKFKDRQSVTVHGTALGTYPFIAPECLRGESHSADGRADIYSLGHILYEMAMGRNFLTRLGGQQAFLNYLRLSPQTGADLRGFQCDFLPVPSVVVAETLAKMLAVERDARYTSIEEVIRALELESDLSQAHPVATPEGRTPVAPPVAEAVPCLVVLSGENKDECIPIPLADDETRTLGRGQISPLDTTISRKHFALLRRNDVLFVRDLSTRNGTFLNSRLIGPEWEPIISGDYLRVGDVYLRVGHQG
jgi:eukaryotic-like serine/threonine-protein kinase